MFKLDLKKQRNHRSNWKHLLDHREIKRVPEEHLLLLYRLCQNLWLCGSRQTVENSERDGNTRPPYLSPEKRKKLQAGQEATVRTGHGMMDWFQNGKGVCQSCIFYPFYLTYMQSTSWEMLDWMKHKLESRLLGDIPITSDMQMTPPLWQKVKKN